MGQFDHLEVYDFENDNKISEKRKEACRLAYSEMELHHLDKLFDSAFVHDKITGDPIAKKPKSIHEFIYFMFQSLKAMTHEVEALKDELRLLKGNYVIKGD